MRSDSDVILYSGEPHTVAYVRAAFAEHKVPEAYVNSYIDSATVVFDGSIVSPEGHWITENGHHIFINGPRIVSGEKVTAPTCPGCKPYTPNPHADHDGDGITDAARVGVAGNAVPPPPDRIPRLPNLTDPERRAETNFAEAFEKNPDGVSRQYTDEIATKNSVATFATDDAKALSGDYNPKGLPEDQVKAAKATYNLAVHQTANAIAKRAFVKYLDDVVSKLPEEKRSVLVTCGGVACHGKDTPVIMFDGSRKMVQDIRVGDILMGPDSLPRIVLNLHRGVAPMYRITPHRGDPFTVNGDHVLCLKTFRVRGSQKRTKLCTVQMKVDEVLSRGKSFRRDALLYRTGVEFSSSDVRLSPYFLGLWLGDGTNSLPEVTSADPEVVEFMEWLAERHAVCAAHDGRTAQAMHLAVNSTPGKASSAYRLALDKESQNNYGAVGSRPNPFTRILQILGVYRNKHIPQSYLVNSRQVRLEVLAGLLDSDGNFDVVKNAFEITTKIERLAYEIQFLARSLGFAASVNNKYVTNPWTGKVGLYYRLHIGGNDLNQIPTHIIRKQAFERAEYRSDGKKSRNVLHAGFKIEAIGVDEYFGFTLDGDHLYLLGDFTITHNSGKDYAIGKIGEVQGLKDQVGAIWNAAGEQNATENPWILNECRKRGIRSVFVYVHNDPSSTWENPDHGVIKRAIGSGRMVDGLLFAESYGIGGKNMQNFYNQNKDAKDIDWVWIDNTGSPKRVSEFPKEAASYDSNKVYARSLKYLKIANAPPPVLRGGSLSERIWGPPKEGRK